MTGAYDEELASTMMNMYDDVSLSRFDVVDSCPF